MNLSIYSDKSFVITGNTKEHKTYLKDMGGRWNANLSCGSGWIFSMTKKKDIEDWLASLQQPQPTLPQPVPQSPSQSIESLLQDFIRYILPVYKTKKVLDILYDFALNAKSNYRMSSDDDDVSIYFNNDNTKLYQYFFLFIKESNVPYSIYKDIDKEKFIEYALLQLTE